jgi:hypothetical protein
VSPSYTCTHPQHRTHAHRLLLLLLVFFVELALILVDDAQLRLRSDRARDHIITHSTHTAHTPSYLNLVGTHTHTHSISTISNMTRSRTPGRMPSSTSRGRSQMRLRSACHARTGITHTTCAHAIAHKRLLLCHQLPLHTTHISDIVRANCHAPHSPAACRVNTRQLWHCMAAHAHTVIAHITMRTPNT